MSLRWMDGFDHYSGSLLERGQGATGESIIANLARAYDTVGGSVFYAGDGRFNGSALYAQGYKNNTYIFKNIGSSAATKYFIGFNLKFIPNNSDFVFICGSVVSNAMATTRGFHITNTTVRLNNTAITTLSQNVWYHIEMEIPVTPSVGDPCRLYINGTQVGTTTTTFNWTNVVGILCQNTGYHYQVWVDDFYIFDNLGTTNNTKAATELYIPRIEYIQPTSDVSNNFTITGGLTVVNQGFEANDTITNDLLACGFTNISFLNYAFIPSTHINYINNTTAFKRTGTYAKELRYTYSFGATYFQFDTIASSITFYAAARASYSGPCNCIVTLNGVATTYSLTDNSTWTQITVTPVDGIVNTVKIAVGDVYGKYLYIDDMQVTYTAKTAAQVLFKTKFSSSNYLSSTANGDKVLCNMENLTNINDIKAVGMVAMASEAVTGVTSSFKFIANNGGSDTEIGNTESVTGSLISTTPYQQELFETNPLTSLPWTSSDVNSIKLGVINKT
jgi:hypothetical protein